MSSAAKKNSGSVVSGSADRLRVVGGGSSSESSQDLIFERMFRSIRGLASEGELFIAQVTPLSRSLEIRFGSGPFAAHVGAVYETGGGALAEILSARESMHWLDGLDLARCISGLSLTRGNVVSFRLGQEDDVVAIIVYFQPETAGELDPTHIAALGSLTDLASMALNAGELKLDNAAQDLHLASIRTELQETELFYRQFSAAIHQCFWVVDLESNRPLVISANFEKVWGADQRVLSLGLTGFMANVANEDKDRVLSEFHEKFGADFKTEFETELRVLAEDGELRWIWLRGYPTDGFGPSPGARRLVLIADDVTEKKSQEELARNREAELISRARMMAVGDLASGVAHEINNPLTVIVGKAAEIQREIAKPTADLKKVGELTDKIQKTSIRISEIILSLKSLTRPEQATLNSSNVAEVIEDLRDMTNQRFRSHDVRLTLAQFPHDLRIDMNSTLVSQCLLNLLTNAFDAVQREKEKWVELDWAEDDDSIYFYVTDSGSGIPIKIRGRIFDPFFTTKEPGKGTGLGLSLAASIAVHHHGVLRLDTFHLHTRFVLQLPKHSANKKP